MREGPRFVELAGASNFRDLGGYRTADGLHTRWGRLYRSDALHELTAADVAILRGLDIRSIVDLRTNGEATRTGRGLLAEEAIAYRNVSISQEIPLSREDGSDGADGRGERETKWNEVENLSGRYLWYLQTGGAAFAQALRHMAESQNYPIVFHCFFGKDRSGVLSALVLSCLGVASSDIVNEYALSEARMERLLARVGQDPLYRETIERTPPAVLAADRVTMERFLAAFEAQFGDARSWALAAGVTGAQLEALAENLLE